MTGETREVWGDLATTAFVEASLLFRPLAPEARQDLLKLATRQAFEPGETVSGAQDDALVLLVDGTAEALGEDGRPLGTLERGGFFGAHRVVGGAPRGWALSARTDVTVVRFPAPVVAALAEAAPRMKKLLEAVQAAREKEAAERLGA
jgi:signal-transduction protein with cAMP-binding, CBS, and nucleotidyltransferase domain